MSALVKYCISGEGEIFFFKGLFFPSYLDIWHTVMGSLRLPLLHIRPFERLPFFFSQKLFVSWQCCIYTSQKCRRLSLCYMLTSSDKKRVKKGKNWRSACLFCSPVSIVDKYFSVTSYPLQWVLIGELGLVATLPLLWRGKKTTMTKAFF